MRELPPYFLPPFSLSASSAWIAVLLLVLCPESFHNDRKSFSLVELLFHQVFPFERPPPSPRLNREPRPPASTARAWALMLHFVGHLGDASPLVRLWDFPSFRLVPVTASSLLPSKRSPPYLFPCIETIFGYLSPLIPLSLIFLSDTYHPWPLNSLSFPVHGPQTPVRLSLITVSGFLWASLASFFFSLSALSRSVS